MRNSRLPTGRQPVDSADCLTAPIKAVPADGKSLVDSVHANGQILVGPRRQITVGEIFFPEPLQVDKGVLGAVHCAQQFVEL
jgi:hypothetical protein